MRNLVTKSEIKKVSLTELSTYSVPKFQRWRNDKNVDSLVQSLAIMGQQREILVCELPTGRKLITDGNHLKEAMKKANYKNAWIRLNQVESKMDAFNLFVEFNTRGRSITTLDFIVSRSTFSDTNVYKKFLIEILNNPSTEAEAKEAATVNKLFTLPSLIKIFLGSNASVRSGKSELPKNYERVKGLFRYLDEHYIYRKEIQDVIKKQCNRKLNGGSIIPVMETIIADKYNHLGYSQILDLLVDFTAWFNKENPTMQFNKDNVGTSFKEYLSIKGL